MQTKSLSELENITLQRLQFDNFLDKDIYTDGRNDLYNGFLQITSTLFIEVQNSDFFFANESENFARVPANIEKLLLDYIKTLKNSEYGIDEAGRKMLWL